MYGHITRVSWIWCTFFWFWHHSRQFKELLNVTQGQVPICMALEGGYEIKVTQRNFFWKCFVRALKINYWAHWMNISGEHASQVGAGGDKGCPGEASWSHVSCINVLNHYCQKSGNFNWSKQISLQSAHWVQGAIGWPGGAAGLGCCSDWRGAAQPQHMAVSGGVQKGAGMGGGGRQLNTPHHLSEDLPWNVNEAIACSKLEPI